MMAKCDCYYQHGMKFLCYGTKEMEECSCGGDTSKCNFYPEKRKPKVQTMANEKRLIDANALAEEVWNIAMYIFGVRNGKTLIKEYLEKYRDSVMKKIAIAPIVDAEPVVHGHWVKYNFLGHDQFACSECQTLGSPQWKRCPVCEAKMDGERKDK